MKKCNFYSKDGKCYMFVYPKEASCLGTHRKPGCEFDVKIDKILEKHDVTQEKVVENKTFDPRDW